MNMKTRGLKTREGFTLIETLVAIALLMLALIAPMSLAAEALTSAYYSRDQITAFYLAQEGIEIVRAVRDANIMSIAEGNSSVNIFDGIPTAQNCASASCAPAFTVDALQVTSNALDTCDPRGCPPLQTNGSVYGYGCETGEVLNGVWQTNDCGTPSGWTDTTFTRTVKAYLLSSSNQDEMRVTVTVTWQIGSLQTQSFTISGDLYRWVSG